MYVHGGIDGYSRYITFLRVTSSNTARTALHCFLDGIRNRGLPSRIRLDHGREYNECERFMNFYRGPDRGSAIRGKSVHNQRIERLWRDVYLKVLDSFYKLFFLMEDSNALDINNPNHMFALHYTFIPRIQLALTIWAATHNLHGIRTEHHKTPQQLWFLNTVQQRCSLQAANGPQQAPQPRPSVAVAHNFDLASHAEDILNQYGIDIADLLSPPDSLPSPLNDADTTELRNRINPLRTSTRRGLDIYRDVINFICDCLERGQQNE